MAAALALALPARAADTQSYVQGDDPPQETYVIDSKGTTVYRNRARVCLFNCAPVATPALSRPPTRLTPPPQTPDGVVSADRYPIRPQETGARRAVPWKPSVHALVPAIAQKLAPSASSPVISAQPAAPQPFVPPEKSDGLTKEQKALILNAGAATFIVGYGIAFWDYFQTSPRAKSEGWFGRTTSKGGADKLGHFWTSYAVGHLFSYVYRWWDFDVEQANALGALSSLGVQTLVEVGDAFSDVHGFAYEDAIMNLAGAGAAYVLGKYPSLARKIDLRLEYSPDKFSDLADDIFTDYDNQRFLVALKLDGFDMFHDSYLSYLELHAGYYTRGYEDLRPNRRRYLYFGVGFNVSKLVQNFVNVGIFDYLQVPYTSIGVRKGLD